VWVHVDMDQFYAAVELKDRPELEGVGCTALELFESALYGVASVLFDILRCETHCYFCA
jgi:hypothetical protein